MKSVRRVPNIAVVRRSDVPMSRQACMSFFSIFLPLAGKSGQWPGCASNLEMIRVWLKLLLAIAVADQSSTIDRYSHLQPADPRHVFYSVT